MPPSEGPALKVVPPPAVFSREGPFDASLKQQPPETTRDTHGALYQMTTYRDSDLAYMDTLFGATIHTLGF